jgi:hypothetical protein
MRHGTDPSISIQHSAFQQKSPLMADRGQLHQQDTEKPLSPRLLKKVQMQGGAQRAE